MNRIWQRHFGTGLVKTSNDFGHNGERPSHRAARLARERVCRGWKVKCCTVDSLEQHVSAGSRSDVTAGAHRVDPDNRLLWHIARRRLSAEEIRDAMLAVSGKLNLKAGGPSVMVPVDPDLVKFLYKPSQWAVTSDRTEHDRRSST